MHQNQFKNVPPEDIPEVVRIASELYGADEARTEEERERQATRDAVGEVGLPPEYLDQAAATLHAQRVAQIQGTRRKKVGVAVVLGVAAVIAGGWVATHRPAPVAATLTLAPAVWQLNTNPESAAKVTFGPIAGQTNAAEITVDHFGQNPTNGQFTVNLDSKSVPQTLSNYKTVTVKVRGNGLQNVRIYLENGSERWRSPNLPVSAQWQTQSVPLDQFDYQTHSGGGWQKQSFQLPGHVEQLSVKLGWYVNDVGSRGTVDISSPQFQ